MKTMNKVKTLVQYTRWKSLDGNLEIFQFMVLARSIVDSYVLNIDGMKISSTEEVALLGAAIDNPASTQRLEDFPKWSYLGRDVPDHNKTKIGRIRFLTYFGSVLSDMQLKSGKIEKNP